MKSLCAAGAPRLEFIRGLRDETAPNGSSLRMLDIVLLAGGIGFFVIATAYVFVCDTL
jgi:hypothetical protein